jgi:hypothetical protein
MSDKELRAHLSFKGAQLARKGGLSEPHKARGV